MISCITSCGKCEYCKKQMYSHCEDGGWVLGHLIDGTQAEYVRIPYADNSLYPVSAGANEEALVMLSDILPAGFEIGVLYGAVKPSDVVARWRRFGRDGSVIDCAILFARQTDHG